MDHNNHPGGEWVVGLENNARTQAHLLAEFGEASPGFTRAVYGVRIEIN